MGYTPHTWSNGETITAAKLNAIEQGVAGSSGYDAEVYIYHPGSSSDPFTSTIVSGDFSTLSAMIADDTPPNILVRYWDDMRDFKFSIAAVAIYTYGGSSIVFFAPALDIYGGVYGKVRFYWNSNDTISDIAFQT